MKKVFSIVLAAVMLLSAFSFGACSKKQKSLIDGKYDINVKSDSSMFKVIKCVLTVENGKMSADLTMSGQGYGAMFMGKGEQAPATPDDSCIAFALDDDGRKVFTIPVEALDKDIICTAWSIKKETWYDRVLVFESESLPKNAFGK